MTTATSKRQSLSMDLIQSLPKSARQRLRVSDLKSITGAILVFDRIEQYFDSCYKLESSLRKWKVANGYCAGRPYCAKHTEDGSMCDKCKKEMRNPKRENKPSEYGMMMLKKRRETAKRKSS